MNEWDITRAMEQVLIAERSRERMQRLADAKHIEQAVERGIVLGLASIRHTILHSEARLTGKQPSVLGCDCHDCQRARQDADEAAAKARKRARNIRAAPALAELRAEVAANPPPAESPPDGELEGRGLGGFRTWRE